eukprot:CAMPEP_0184503658 /NCGR_PEP_ID=MMETSP0113_2-20130426/52024_1 /TAXON_ID=91329 /ORGANISM="Norrisiella sphaerica, Strain BC52" /LENGTH=356 /DNA_ID=CAMNT_0026893199 /DNA_START=357 /DNA_END=1427 /DNA_ORIENTATION=-
MDATNAPQIVEYASQSVNFTPFATKWIPCSPRFVCLGTNPRNTGAMVVYELNKGKLKETAKVTTPAGLKCATFGASFFEKRQMATGDYKGKLNIWDLNNMKKAVFSVQAHSGIVHCIDGVGGLNIGGGAPEIVTGGHDGCVRVWDPRQTRPVCSIEPAKGEHARECWAVAFGNSFNDSERMVATGYDNGDLKMLDLRAQKLVWECNVNNGIVDLQFDRKDIEMNKLAVTTLESRFRIFDMRTYHPSEGYSCLTQKAHKSTVWVAAHLPQNRDVLTTLGGNGTLNLWKYRYPAKRREDDGKGNPKGVMGSLDLLNSKRFSEQPIVSFDWSMDKPGLCTMCSLDQQVRVAIVTKLNKV